MTEEIIIDGVDVAGCEFLRNCIIPDNYGCKIDDSLCCDVGNCYYKQLKRLEQERDELKKTVENQKLEYEELQCDLSEVENACGCYQSENAKLKQENKANEKQIELDVEHICRLNEQIKKLEQENKELRKANEISIEKVTVTAEAKRLQELEQENKELKTCIEMIKNTEGQAHIEGVRLAKENKELKIYIESNKQQVEEAEMLVMDNDRLQQEVENLKDTIYYDVENYRSALEEILESAKFAQCLPCGSGNLEDCLNCNDDTTNNGQFCMEKRIHEIKTKCVKVLNEK